MSCYLLFVICILAAEYVLVKLLWQPCTRAHAFFFFRLFIIFVGNISDEIV